MEMEMKGLLLQYDDRSPLWAEKLVERNALAAKRLHFDHLYLNESEFDESIPPYWRKVFLVEKYLKRGHPVVVWIDSDAVLVNETEFLSLLNNEMSSTYCIAFSSNPGILRKEWWFCRLWSAPFCAGVFVVKNTEKSLDILGEWKRHFNPTLWTAPTLESKNKKWLAVGLYGGSSYEQGCFELRVQFLELQHPWHCVVDLAVVVPVEDHSCTTPMPCALSRSPSSTNSHTSCESRNVSSTCFGG